jgi:hypothetical protein
MKLLAISVVRSRQNMTNCWHLKLTANATQLFEEPSAVHSKTKQKTQLYISEKRDTGNTLSSAWISAIQEQFLTRIDELAF